MRDLYSCRICQSTCLEDLICCPFPEPLIGNWKASFAIVGINPGPSSGNFEDLNQYIAYYSNSKECGLILDPEKRWQIGYVKAYTLLFSRPGNTELAIDDFNENAVILNVIKCSTADASKIRGQRLEMAKANCIDYLARQLEIIKPKVILTHGKPSCLAMIDVLKNETKFTIVSTSSDKSINTLAEEMRRPYSMDEISKEYIEAKSENGHRTLFLFNKHLSYCGPAAKSLDKKLEEKRKKIDDVLHD